ncbi:hypothetical protein [Methylobacterium radiodurans]|uniref:Uncharacterized protein n=1 Tax=Methylobacterium radiodurans TaxID=2202828 RepID=A0A2U8VSK3_9HYPH|nr:hypothetical protein [Methylobacterium radiodurans]AWN36370.1 hypothetical protein DK427_12060 [Methylobacterium radiodurans]
MADQTTTGEFRKPAEIADDEIKAAVGAVLAKPETGEYSISGSYLLDLAAAVQSCKPAAEALANPDAKPS